MVTMKRSVIILCVLFLAQFAYGAAPVRYSVSSPDGALEFVLQGEQWSLLRDGHVVIAPSSLGLALDDGTVFRPGSRPPRVSRAATDAVRDARFYKKTSVRDRYNEMRLRYRDFDLVVRAYDAAVAWRIEAHRKSGFKVLDDFTEFAFPTDCEAWFPYVRQNRETLSSQFNNSFENTYTHSTVSGYDASLLTFLPITLRSEQGELVCITEASLLDYPGMYLYNPDGALRLKGVFAPYPKTVRQGGHNNIQEEVVEREDYLAVCSAAEKFPWRVVNVAENDAALLDNDIVWLLSEASEGDFSWVKPGKVAWDWWNDWNIGGVDFASGVNTRTYCHYIDFAAANGIEYVILDEGWSVEGKADLLSVVPDIDLKGIVDYASARGVGIILWAGYYAIARDMENIFRHYSAMGVKGFKVDFMDRDDQSMVAFYERAASLAAKYRLVLDFHGAFKPCGLQRTWPNVLNFEGVFGLEMMKFFDAATDQMENDVTIPFARMVAGSLDYTQGAMRNASRENFRPVVSEPMSQGTRCHQLALYTIFLSPLNMLCDTPTAYTKERECLDFIAGVPTVWDETRALSGEIGEYVVIARRKGNDWYLGAITDWQPRDITIDLSFLGAGPHKAVVFQDGANAHRLASDYLRKEMLLDTALTVHLAPGGGFTAKISLAR